MNLYNFQEERVFLSGMLAFPEYFLSDFDHLVSDADFYSVNTRVNKTIFNTSRSLIEEKGKIDIYLLNHHLSSLQLSFRDNLTLDQYLESIEMLSENITEHEFKNSFEVIKMLSLRRDFSKMGDTISETMKSLDSQAGYDLIVDSVDKIVNDKIELYENSGGEAVNLFKEMQNLVFERANDRSIYADAGPPGPYPSLNRLCGSLSKGGHITIICAGSGVGKTQLTTHYCTYMAGKHKIPVLHLDNGEMTQDEIAFRMCASHSRVPLKFIESGEWHDDLQYKSAVEKTLEKMNNEEIIYDYYNVGGKNIDEIISYIKRYYLSKIGRGNKLIINFDYIKSSFETASKSRPEYQVVGEMIDKFKKVIQRDLACDGKAHVSLIAGVQANRVGTVGNRSSDNIVDDESVVSMSHRIKQFCSHLLILRNKSMDELQNDPHFCGRHLIKIEKARNVGVDHHRLENEVEMPDGSYSKNYVNIELDNFKIIDHGDLVDMLAARNEINDLATNDTLDLPNI